MHTYARFNTKCCDVCFDKLRCGPAALFFDVSSEEELVERMKLCNEGKGKPYPICARSNATKFNYIFLDQHVQWL